LGTVFEEPRQNRLMERMLPPRRARAYRLSVTCATSGRETIYVVSLEISFLDDGRSLNA
jgi:hypothetical protein